MRILIGRLWVLLAITAACQAQLSAAEDGYLWVSGDGPSARAVADEKPAVKDTAYGNCGETACGGQGTECGSCGSCAGGGGACCDLGCDDSPQRGIVGIFGFDSFKGVSDSLFQSNFGVVTGLNAATPVPGLSDYGIGWQLGMTYGVYDIDGGWRYRDSAAQSQQQTFVTTGFYRKGNGDQRLSFGLVYDWMLNDNWGVLGTSPTLGQWRGQVEYAVGDCNAIGLYGSMRDLGSQQRVYNTQRYYLDTETRAISQVNLFWHHKFCSGADSWLWVGVPERERLDRVDGGSLGDWIIGANIQVPITERLALYGNAQYMHPSAAASRSASIDSTWNVGAGIMWYFGGHAESHSLNGKCWLPYMPVANNSTFLVDQNPVPTVLY
jgi:hypothetical protein